MSDLRQGVSNLRHPPGAAGAQSGLCALARVVLVLSCMSYHHVGRALPGTLLFTTHEEARLLWEAVVRRIPVPLALCLMPDHLHLLCTGDRHDVLGRAMSAFARSRNHRRGEQGAVWRRQAPPEEVRGSTKQRRSVRYIHLNPSRARLVADPLAWPWSTHRDRCGLLPQSAGLKHRDPVAFHRYVSSDPTVRIEGTDLPIPIDLVQDGLLGVQRLGEAVSEVTRCPMTMLGRRGAPRTLWIRAGRIHSRCSNLEIAAVIGVSPQTVRNSSNRPDRWTRAVAAAAGDLVRFPGLIPGDLRNLWFGQRYRSFT